VVNLLDWFFWKLGWSVASEDYELEHEALTMDKSEWHEDCGTIKYSNSDNVLLATYTCENNDKEIGIGEEDILVGMISTFRCEGGKRESVEFTKPGYDWFSRIAIRELSNSIERVETELFFSGNENNDTQ